MSFLANSEKVRPEHLESIKSIFVAAAPFGEATAHKFLEKAPHVVFREGKVSRNDIDFIHSVYLFLAALFPKLKFKFRKSEGELRKLQLKED